MVRCHSADVRQAASRPLEVLSLLGKIFLVALSSVCLVFPFGCFARATACRCVMPSQIASYCQSKYPDGSLLTCDELDAEMVQYLQKTRGKDFCPSMVQGSFTDPSYTENVVMVRRAKGTGSFIVVLLLHIQSGKIISASVLDERQDPASIDQGKRPAEVYLSFLPKGFNIHTCNSDDTLLLPANAVVLHFFERSAIGYYWDGRSYCAVCIED